MDYKKLSAYGMMAVAALMVLQNVSDKWADVQAWTGATAIFTPAFVSVLIKQLMPLLLGAAGGLMLPTIGPSGGYDGVDRRGTLPEKIAAVVAADPATSTVTTNPVSGTIKVETQP